MTPNIEQAKRFAALRTLLRTFDVSEFHDAYAIWKSVRSEKESDVILDRALAPGMKVTFEARGKKWVGTITRLGKKNVTVDCPAAANQSPRPFIWRVSASFLTILNAEGDDHAMPRL